MVGDKLRVCSETDAQLRVLSALMLLLLRAGKPHLCCMTCPNVRTGMHSQLRQNMGLSVAPAADAGDAGAIRLDRGEGQHRHEGLPQEQEGGRALPEQCRSSHHEESTLRSTRARAQASAPKAGNDGAVHCVQALSAVQTCSTSVTARVAHPLVACGIAEERHDDR